MLRRQPTAITLTSEDVLKFEEDRQRRLAQNNSENAFDRQQASNVTEKHATEEPRQKTANDRIMGSATAN
jgi:hypothetical protein